MSRNSNAGQVAKEVIKQIANGERPNVKDAMLKSGYSRITSDKNAKKITSNKEYKRVIKPFIDELDELISDAIDIIKKKQNKATYRDGIEGIHKLKQLKALETGKSTENVAIQVGWSDDKEA